MSRYENHATIIREWPETHRQAIVFLDRAWWHLANREDSVTGIECHKSARDVIEQAISAVDAEYAARRAA